MKEPHFIIGGATRGGIVAMTNILRAHPQVFIPGPRDSKFFQKGVLVKRSLRSCKEYFEDVADIRINREIPRDRILHGEEEFDPARAAQGAPYAKVIFTLRNPVIRAHMQFHNARARGKEKARTLEQAINEELEGVRTPENSPHCWIFKNQYQKHLSAWLDYYPREKIKIMICEEWSTGLHRGLGGLESFLGLQPGSLTIRDALRGRSDENRPYYEKTLPKILDYPPLMERTQEQLDNLFSVDIEFVENLLARKVLSWS